MTRKRLTLLRDFLRDHLRESEGIHFFADGELDEVFALAHVGLNYEIAKSAPNFNLKEGNYEQSR